MLPIIKISNPDFAAFKVEIWRKEESGRREGQTAKPTFGKTDELALLKSQ
jgi:hypothetical protein